MSHDEKFQQRWKFRRKDDEEDSSSTSSGEPMDKKLELVNTLVLPENEVRDAPTCHQRDKLDAKNDAHTQPAKAAKKKAKSRKKEHAEPNKPKRSLAAKGTKKRKRNLCSKETVMLEELKNFACSLINELKAAREEMSERMKEETSKWVSSRTILRPVKRKARSTRTKKVQPQEGTKLNVKAQKWSRGLRGMSTKSNVTSDASNAKAVEGFVKHNQVLESATTIELRSQKSNAASDVSKFAQYGQILELHKAENLRPSMKSHMVLSTDSDSVFAPPSLTLRTVIPKSQPQNQRNGTSINGHVPAGVHLGSEIEIGKLMDAKNSHHGFPSFQPEEQFGSFPFFSDATMGFLGQNCSQTSGTGIGFPVPFQQGLGNGNMPSQTYSENSLRNESKVGSPPKFPGGNPALSEYVLANNISNKMYHASDGEFVSLSSQDVQDSQLYLATLRNRL